MAVNDQHPNYFKHIEKCRIVRAILDNDARHLIRTVDANDLSRSLQYKEDAILTNFTRLTRDGLKGLVFRKPSIISVPEDLDYLLTDATGEGFSLDQLANKCVSEVLTTGMYGLLVDYPKVDPTQYNEEVARIKGYRCENIINVKRRHVGSKYVLSLVVLQEEVVDGEDIFSWNPIHQYRVLFLDDNGFYGQIVYSMEGELKEDVAYPRDANGNLWREIPFQFIGSENNDSEYDNIPLYDIAIINLGHYRNSADLEESSYICGQPFLVINPGDTSAEEFKAANEGVKFGSRAGLVTGNGGSASLLQANPNQLVAQMMKDKLLDAAATGARLIAPAGGRETAEAARIRYGSQNSNLYVITNNISLGIIQAIRWVAKYQNVAELEDIEFYLNDQFYDETADPNLIMQQIMLLDKGVISKDVIREYGRRTGFIDEELTNEDLDADATPIATPASPQETNNSEETFT